MAYQTILYDVRDRVAAITLNQPERRNPLSEETAAELLEAFSRAEADDDVRVLVLTGAGDVFSAGGDVREFAARLDQPAVRVYEDGRQTAEFILRSARITKPLLGAINGGAYGGGFGLVAMCHLAIASERAKFGLTEIRLGLFPLSILPPVRAALGDRKTLELALTGAVIDAAEALRIGLVHRVVPHGQLQASVWETADSLAAHSPLAVRLGLIAFAESRDATMDGAVRYLHTLRAVLLKSEDVREGATAFLEKREPRWQGR